MYEKRLALGIQKEKKEKKTHYIWSLQMCIILLKYLIIFNFVTCSY
jgi:hypothetical protein